MDRISIAKRNFIFMTCEGVCFFCAQTFMDATSIIPLFIVSYTGSLALTGLSMTIKNTIFFIPQIMIGPFIDRIKNMPGYLTKVMFISRPIIFLMVPVLLLNIDHYLTVGIFFAIYTLIYIGEGFINTPWLVLLNRTIPPDRRGKLLGNQQMFSGLAGIAGGIVIKMILDDRYISDGARFAMIFGIAGIFSFMSGVCMSFARDNERKIDPDEIKMISYFKKLPLYIKSNKDYLNIVIIQLLSGFTGMIAPFVVLFCKDYFKLQPQGVSMLVYSQIIGALIGGYVWGELSRRIGNKYVVMVSQLVGLLIGAAAPLITGFNLKAFSAASFIMAFLNGIYAGCWLGFVNYIMDVVEEKLAPVYLTITNILTFPNTFLFYIAGIIAGKYGYIPIFTMSAAGAFIAFVLSLGLKTKAQLY
ncbi:MAG TPA: hypothetical protein DD426_13365 [Clostridiaceae bacterium]|nr:hypothetical protein [Clostridiaceae bacterium]